MKKLIASLAILASVAAFADIDDTSVFVWTAGPDTYADGTSVIDGEYYALCWSAGEFAGLNADGSLVNSADKILGIYPAAQGGKCKLFKYTLKADQFNQGGNITLWLLDTRVYGNDGAVSVAKQETTTKVASVNAAKAVKAAIDVQSAGAGVRTEGAVAIGGGDVTAVPADAPKPTVKSIKVGDVYIEIEVENTVPYLAYDLKAGSAPDKLEAGAAKNAVNGKAGETITLYAEKKDKAFFQVNRK